MAFYKKLTLYLGYFSLALLFGVVAFVFVGFMQKDAVINTSVSFKIKEKAKGVDIYRKAKRTYHIKAVSMEKLKNNVVRLYDPKLWIMPHDKEPITFIKARYALIYPDNDVYAYGGVSLKRSDLNIFSKDARFDAQKDVIYSKNPFSGYNKSSVFKGKSFKYLTKNSELIVWGVDIWLKQKH
ncbi:LPS export ABC transporter periplasmic protein LptC [Hippea jasoniae]|uniref:LPS export ABC transporter periplasmic protein LptC n=1 Tax=Hippea jasoniae TaxID=944479 RepID=UPI00054F8209|nr:LPS export ABC transporter periplasmic protein LptC [Hippea jasoniae]